MSPAPDIEKDLAGPDRVEVFIASGDAATSRPASAKAATSAFSFLSRLNEQIEGLAGFEARGITRVLPEERQPPSLASDVQVAVLWFSANISVNNMTAGLFGPLFLVSVSSIVPFVPSSAASWEACQLAI